MSGMEKKTFAVSNPYQWVFSSGKLLRYSGNSVDNKYSTVLHRASCIALRDVPCLGEASPPEIAAGYWWDRLSGIDRDRSWDDEHAEGKICALDSSSDENAQDGTAFELLSHFHINDSWVCRWLDWEFCKLCVPEETNRKSVTQFVSMLNTEELAEVVDDLAGRIIETAIETLVPAAIYDLLTEVSKRLESQDDELVDLIEEENNKKEK